MNRLLALLIVPLLVVGNSLSHTHAAIDAPSNCAERPHVHVADFHHSHGENYHLHGDEDAGSDRSEQPTPEHWPDHDSDAVYLSGGQFFLPISVASLGELQLDCVGFVGSDFRLHGNGCRTDLLDYEVPIRTGPPLFLLHAALRL